MQLDSSIFGFRQVNQAIPDEGPRVIPITLDFSLSESFEIDLQNIVARDIISMVQAIYIDNSANPAPVSVNFPRSGQTITMAPNRQGYRLVICPNPPYFVFSSAGGVPVIVHLMNWPTVSSDWPTITGA